MDRIKSAYEMAMERFKQRKEIPQNEIDKMEYTPEGKAIAAKYLREKEFDFFSEVNKFPGSMRDYILEGAQETFLNNILLPVDKATSETNKRAMEGLFLVKRDKETLKEAFSQLEHFFQYYERTLEHAYVQFKERYAAKMSATLRSLEKRVGGKIKVDPEKQPGFREEWMRAIGGINAQYEQVLGEQKERLRSVK